MIALFLTAAKLLHDGFLSDLHIFSINFIIFGHRLDGSLLLVDNLIQNHLQILIGIVPFLLDALDLFLDAVDLIVLLSNIYELSLEAVIELIRREEEFAIIQGLLLIINLCFDLTVGVLLPHVEVIILLQEDLTLSLQFFKIIEKRLIDLLNTIDDDTYKDIVRT